MNFHVEKKDPSTLALFGRLDSLSAPDMEEVLATVLPTANHLVLDMESLEYISSAGLRVILKIKKALAHKGDLKLKNVSEAVYEVLESTGFSDCLLIE